MLKVVTALGAIAVMMISTVSAFAEQAERKTMLVFVLNDDDGTVAQQVKAGMALPDPSGLKDYLIGYDIQVIPFGSGIKNITDIETTTLPAIRAIPEYRDVPMLFYYPVEMKSQFTDLLKTHFDGEMASMQNGWTDIIHGVSYANNVGDIFHEGAHLITCGTWHDQYGRPLEYVTQYPNANKYPWC